MKRCILILFCAIAFSWSSTIAFAQENIVVGSYTKLLGQDHRYSVTLRGNGEAIVTVRIVFTNQQNTLQEKISFRVPKVLPTDIKAFQVVHQNPCRNDDANDAMPLIYPINLPCLSDQKQDGMNWYGPATYQQTTTTLLGDTIEITLPQPILSNKTGSLILYYRAIGYAKKTIVGSYNFVFETIKSDESIQALQVGITTDTDLFLRGTKSKVHYQFDESVIDSKNTEPMFAPMANSRMDSFYQQIGQGELIKTASNLGALESYSVRGSFADSFFKLYAKEIGIGIGSIILFVAISYVLVRWILKTNHQSTHLASHVLMVFGLSFISAIITIGYSVILLFFTQHVSSVFEYQSQMPMMLILMVISLGVYGLLLGAPALFIGIKRGVWYGLATLGLSVSWLIVALLVSIILSASGKNRMLNYPIEVMNANIEQIQAVPDSQTESAPLP